MGLDMYLSARLYTSEHNRDDANLALRTALATIPHPPTQESATELQIGVIYWRKANAIHKWFVDNVQGGEDDCGAYSVAPDTLKELRDICVDVSKHRFDAKAKAKLPPTDGFFFGSTDLDEYYYDEVKRTGERLTTLIGWMEANPMSGWTLEYSSSW